MAALNGKSTQNIIKPEPYIMITTMKILRTMINIKKYMMELALVLMVVR